MYFMLLLHKRSNEELFIMESEIYLNRPYAGHTHYIAVSLMNVWLVIISLNSAINMNAWFD